MNSQEYVRRSIPAILSARGRERVLGCVGLEWLPPPHSTENIQELETEHGGVSARATDPTK